MRGFMSIPLLAIGTVLGYGFAFHSMHHRGYQRDAWERHIGDVCVRAARHVKDDNVKRDNVKGESVAPPTESSEP